MIKTKSLFLIVSFIDFVRHDESEDEIYLVLIMLLKAVNISIKSTSRGSFKLFRYLKIDGLMVCSLVQRTKGPGFDSQFRRSKPPDKEFTCEQRERERERERESERERECMLKDFCCSRKTPLNPKIFSELFKILSIDTHTLFCPLKLLGKKIFLYVLFCKQTGVHEARSRLQALPKAVKALNYVTLNALITLVQNISKDYFEILNCLYLHIADILIDVSYTILINLHILYFLV